jgi:hypothetical protein
MMQLVYLAGAADIFFALITAPKTSCFRMIFAGKLLFSHKFRKSEG